MVSILSPTAYRLICLYRSCRHINHGKRWHLVKYAISQLRSTCTYRRVNKHNQKQSFHSLWFVFVASQLPNGQLFIKTESVESFVYLNGGLEYLCANKQYPTPDRAYQNDTCLYAVMSPATPPCASKFCRFPFKDQRNTFTNNMSPCGTPLGSTRLEICFESAKRRRKSFYGRDG